MFSSFCRPKRGLEEFNDIPNEVLADEVFNMPLKSLSREQLQNSPWLQYVLIRKNSLYLVKHFFCIITLNFNLGILYYLQEKRNPPMTPRLGRSSSSSQTSTSTDEQGNTQERSRPPFAPRLGKKSLEFSPRLGRSFFSGLVSDKIHD